MSTKELPSDHMKNYWESNGAGSKKWRWFYGFNKILRCLVLRVRRKAIRIINLGEQLMIVGKVFMWRYGHIRFDAFVTESNLHLIDVVIENIEAVLKRARDLTSRCTTLRHSKTSWQEHRSWSKWESHFYSISVVICTGNTGSGV